MGVGFDAISCYSLMGAVLTPPASDLIERYLQVGFCKWVSTSIISCNTHQNVGHAAYRNTVWVFQQACRMWTMAPHFLLMGIQRAPAFHVSVLSTMLSYPYLLQVPHVDFSPPQGEEVIHPLAGNYPVCVYMSK